MKERSPRDITHIEQRTPVLDKESVSNFLPDKLDKEWGLITEAVRRDIVASHEVREKLQVFCTEPVSEKLPDDLLKSLSEIDTRTGKLHTRYAPSLGGYLDLPAVPDAEIQPDITNALLLARPKEMTEGYTRALKKDLKHFDEWLDGEIQRYIDSGKFLRGITVQERILIAQRYRFARDIKLLALGAELLEEKNNVTFDQHGEAVLPSGIRIHFDEGYAEEEKNAMLSPHEWRKRKQIKDRVYEVDVGGKSYILKEKKTARHTDVKKGGHKEGRSSAEEFVIAKDLQEHGTAERGRLRLTWEKPIGYVEYPDGFQFSIFEQAGGLLDNYAGEEELHAQIVAHCEQFEPEYIIIKESAEKFKNSPEVVGVHNTKSETGLRALMKRLGLQKDVSSPEAPLTFEEFARVKALRMCRQAESFLQEVIIQNHYHNDDLDGFAFRIHTDDRVDLEIVGFDFEYFQKMNEDWKIEALEYHKKFIRNMESSQGIGFASWDANSVGSRMEQAAYFAMLDIEGILERDAEGGVDT